MVARDERRIGGLRKEQREQYEEDGFLFPIDILNETEAADYRTQIEAIEHDWLDAGLPQPLNTYKRINAHLVMPLAAELGLHPRILDLAESVLGPDFLVYSVEFFIKEAGTKHVVTMHQDLTYWGWGESDGILTAWLALSPSTGMSGCMDFVRGSHKNPILPHEDTFDDANLLSRGQEIAVQVDDADKVRAELKPGQISLHHGLMIHGSGPNRSEDRRIGVAIRYLRADVLKPGGLRDFAMAARGSCDNATVTLCPPPSSLFAPEALALYEEVRLEQANVMMAGARAQSGMYAKKG